MAYTDQATGMAGDGDGAGGGDTRLFLAIRSTPTTSWVPPFGDVVPGTDPFGGNRIQTVR